MRFGVRLSEWPIVAVSSRFRNRCPPQEANWLFLVAGSASHVVYRGWKDPNVAWNQPVRGITAHDDLDTIAAALHLRRKP